MQEPKKFALSAACWLSVPPYDVRNQWSETHTGHSPERRKHVWWKAVAQAGHWWKAVTS